MRGRGLLFLSIALNVALAAGFFFLWNSRPGPRPAAGLRAATNAPVRDRIVPIYRKQFFAWSELESTNYDIYVANLRDIGCPESTIHDIILADVNKLYDERRAGADQTPERAKALDDERRTLLTRLLGENWDAAETKAGFAFSKVAFTDPLLDDLPDDLRAKVQDILTRWSQQAVTDKQAAAVLEQKMRFELAGVLSPPQLEELLSRYSANALNLNDQFAELKFFRATPDEFHNCFRATDQLDLQLRLLGDADDPVAQAQRQALRQQREFAIKTALGPKRYAEYQRLQDPDFRDAVAQTLASGSAPPAAQALFQINQETTIQKTLVQADPGLTETQKAVALKQIELDQMKARAQAEGQVPEPPPLPVPMTEVNRAYLLSSGESLASLAQRFQVSPDKIRAANPNLNFSAIKPGETVYIPVLVPAQ
jgi:hypothetical protein